MQKSRPTQNKRARERARQEKQQQKTARRMEAASRKASRPANSSEEDPDIAGIVPGILTGLILIAASWWLCRRYGFVGGTEPPSGRRLLRAVLDARWALLAPIIVLGGIYGGVFTPTEASVVAAVYGLVVGLFVYRELTWRKIYQALLNALLVGGSDAPENV